MNQFKITSEDQGVTPWGLSIFPDDQGPHHPLQVESAALEGSDHAATGTEISDHQHMNTTGGFCPLIPQTDGAQSQVPSTSPGLA